MSSCSRTRVGGRRRGGVGIVERGGGRGVGVEGRGGGEGGGERGRVLNFYDKIKTKFNLFFESHRPGSGSNWRKVGTRIRIRIKIYADTA